MGTDTVLVILAALEAAGVCYWIGGGWGIDALLHRQTRAHRDLDLAVPEERTPQVLRLLDGLGFKIVDDLDWSPARIVLRDHSAHEVDVHPVCFGDEGTGIQANVDGLPPFSYPADELTSGMIAQRKVQCISAALQLEFHRGYVLSQRDLDDLDLLRSSQMAGRRGGHRDAVTE